MGTSKEARRTLKQDPQMLQQALQYGRKRHLEEYWRLNPLRDPAQYGSQALSTISTSMSLRLMKWHEENTPTTTTRVVTTKITTGIKNGYYGKKGLEPKTPRALTRRKMTRKNLRTRMSTLR